jgi:RNA polymerase subunit RPABC4/transcription elongation factor Spt4
MTEPMMECPSCALEAPKDAETCPYCGYEFPRTRISVKWAAILMALLLIWPLIKLFKWLF